MLKVVTYLAPSIPRVLFEALTEHLGGAVGRHGALHEDATKSGPRPGEPDPFSSGAADVGFICATSYAWLTARTDRPVRLLGAWVPDDPRAGGRPEYYADVVVRADSGIRAFGDLAGQRVAYNDDASLSGYFSLLFRLRRHGVDERFLAALHKSGSHVRSLALVRDGVVDAAAVDSNVLRIQRRAAPALVDPLRVADTWGPHPVQPVVVRAALPPPVRRRLQAALLTAHRAPAVARALRSAGLRHFAAVGDGHYDPVRAALAQQRDERPRPGG